MPLTELVIRTRRPEVDCDEDSGDSGRRWMGLAAAKLATPTIHAPLHA